MFSSHELAIILEISLEFTFVASEPAHRAIIVESFMISFFLIFLRGLSKFDALLEIFARFYGGAEVAQ